MLKSVRASVVGGLALISLTVGLELRSVALTPGPAGHTPQAARDAFPHPLLRLDLYNLQPDFDSTNHAAIADFNGDGHPDIFFASHTQPLKLHINAGHDTGGDGYLNFIPINAFPAEPLCSLGAVVHDLSGDGYPDIYTGTDGQNRLYINHARALGGGATCRVLPAYRADLDCDGDVDVADILIVAGAWPEARGTAGYRQYYDLDHDGRVSVMDVMCVASSWSETFDAGPHFPLDYDPYRPGQAPGGPRPSPAEIGEDMATMSQETRLIRSYGACDDLAGIPAIAEAHGIHVYQGVSLSATPTANEQGMSCFAGLVREEQNVVAGVIGGETLRRGELSEWNLVWYLNWAKRLGNVAVTTGESRGVWCNEAPVKPRCQGRRLLGEAVDFILAHSHPYWEGVPIEHAAAHVVATYLTLRATYPHRLVVIGETGWPTCGDPYGNAVPGLENQRRFIEELWRWSNLYAIPVLYFEAFDEEWKVADEGPVGGCWDMYYAISS